MLVLFACLASHYLKDRCPFLKPREKNNPITYDEIPFFPLWECKDNIFFVYENTFSKKSPNLIKMLLMH